MNTQTKRAEIRSFHKVQSCEPTFTQLNEWICGSTTTNEMYQLEVYFNGYSDTFSHGFDLQIVCTCMSGRYGKPCSHSIAVLNKYEANWAYLFDLFGLSRDASFAELREKAEDTYERLVANQYQKAVA